MFYCVAVVFCWCLIGLRLFGLFVFDYDFGDLGRVYCELC